MKKQMVHAHFVYFLVLIAKMQQHVMHALKVTTCQEQVVYHAQTIVVHATLLLTVQLAWQDSFYQPQHVNHVH